MNLYRAACTLLVLLPALYAQKVDFKRDVQPIFKANCYGCHGPAQQMNGFRLDRRADAMRGGTLAMIGPGNADGSRMYKRLIGSQYGLQMPPTGPLDSAQIDIVKRWIDQGAEWPDDVSGEAPPPPPDAGAARIMSALRKGDGQAFRKALTADSKSVNRKGPFGSTPLMYAVLYSDAAAVRLLLDKGADPNIRNDAGASALMWAADDPAKARLLVDHSADVNARADTGRTPLMIAAAKGNPEAVKLLLDHHADPNAQAPGLLTGVTVLAEAAANPPVLRLLLDHGADVKKAGFFPLFISVVAGCTPCSDIFFQSAGPDVVNPVMFFLAPPLGDATKVKLMLDHGADPNAKDPAGNTILMLAASSEHMPVDTVKALLDRKVDVNARNPDGMTALDFARRQGQNTPIVELLLKAGAQPGSGAAAPMAKPKPAESARAAVMRTMPLLQKTDTQFLRQAGCVSCHNNTLAALTLVTAQKSGLPVDTPGRDAQLKKIATYLDTWRERALQGVGIPGDADTVSSILVGMAAQGYAPDPATDAMAFFLKGKQLPNGMWAPLAHRPPLEASPFAVTALTVRALQTYAPKARKAEFDQSIQRAKAWVLSTEPHTVDDRSFQLMALGSLGADRAVIRKFGEALIKEQRPDGGWTQLPTLECDAYATGEALVALRESGAVASSDAAYKRGVQFLLNTQQEDGSWYVASRAIPLQPYFESGFPHGHDQWISSTATNWAAMALLQ